MSRAPRQDDVVHSKSVGKAKLIENIERCFARYPRIIARLAEGARD
jgi:hypothetical protein